MVGDAVDALVREVGAPAFARSARALADRIARHRESARATTPSMKLAALLVGLVVVTGCEKSGSGAAESAALTAGETAMLGHLPKGSNALFGGNYMKFQNYLGSSPMFAKAMALVDKTVPGVAGWLDCWAKEMPKLEMLGSIKLDIETQKLTMQVVMNGADLSRVEKCAIQASFPMSVDPDHKFMSYELPSAMGTVKSGYLVLADGMIYTRQTISLGGQRYTGALERRDLEADIVGLQMGTAQNDTALVAEAAKIDRKKSMWFVASGANTPAYDKVGLARGTFDIENGMTADLSVEIKDGRAADKLENTVGDAKEHADRLPGAMGQMIKALKFSRSGDEFRFTLSLSDKQLSNLFDQLAPLLGAGRP